MTSIFHESTTATGHADCEGWPPEDQATWCALFDPADPKAWQRWSRRRQKPWSRPRQYKVARVYTRYLACVRRHGFSEAITPNGVQVFVEELEQTGTPRTVHGHICALKSVARLLHPGRDWSFLNQTCSNLGRVAQNTPKKRTRVHWSTPATCTVPARR